MIPVTVTNLTAGGFRIEGTEFLRIGEYVGLQVEHYGEFPAQIRWALGTEAGGVFRESVTLATQPTGHGARSRPRRDEHQ